MTTLALAQIPSDINTVEQLALWCDLVLTAVNGQSASIEAPNTVPEPIAQYNVFTAPNDGLRILSRLNIPLDPAVAADRTKKFWRFAKEMSTGTVPASYTAN